MYLDFARHMTLHVHCRLCSYNQMLNIAVNECVDAAMLVMVTETVTPLTVVVTIKAVD